jgi:two-component system sensor histidine kinase/response regulator
VESIEQLRAASLASVPAVIMVTAYGRDWALGAAAQRGVPLATVLTKPVTPSTLLDAIGEALDKGVVATARVEVRAEAQSEAMSKLAGARVLLVEDIEMNQELAIDLLRHCGVEVEVANHGQQALEMLAASATDFDGVLMDCQMPVMDGYTASREIRKIARHDKLPIIAMTANAMAGDREKVLAAGMCDHIAKPLNVAQMYATMARWITPATPLPAAAVDAAPVGEASAPLTLPGIDVKVGMANTMDNPQLYQRMLYSFGTRQGDFGSLFAAARADADAAAAARAAHTLKGCAGTIGAAGVQTAAGLLEQACLAGEGDARIDALLADTLASLAPVISGLQALKGAPATVATEASDMPLGVVSADLRERIADLARLLDDGDMDAIGFIADLVPQARGSTLEAVLARVAGLVENCDFDAALAALEQAG